MSPSPTVHQHLTGRFRLMLTAKPGGALLEALVVYNPDTELFRVHGDVERNNR